MVSSAAIVGEVAPDVDPNLIIETSIGPLGVRLLRTGQPVANDRADGVAELVARGVAQGQG